jgi:hypothetical protein
MANIPIWNNNPGPAWGNTPFGFYDNDLEFQQEAPLFAIWCSRRLGYPIVNIELQDINFYAAFEEAVTTYGNEVYQWKIRENYLAMQGNSTGSILNNQVVTPTLGSIIRIAEAYASEAGAGGFTTYYTGSIEMTASIQDYDLKQWAISQGISGSGIEIKKIFFEAPPAIVRYFDPYAGTGTGIQSLLETFGFGQFSPGINFLLMPIYFDVQKLQAIELNDQIRKSAFSFDLVNNNLRIFPIPNRNEQLFFHYIKRDERDNVTAGPYQGNGGVITDISNVPYENPVFGYINTIGKQWIRQYALAAVKETLAYVRKKYAAIPIPGAEVTLNGDNLVSSAATERDALITRLREYFDQTSRQALLERRQAESVARVAEINQVPMTIFIG